jgi:hypothetical protein
VKLIATVAAALMLSAVLGCKSAEPAGNGCGVGGTAPPASGAEIAAIKAAGLPPGVVETASPEGPRLDGMGLVAEMLRRWAEVRDYTSHVRSEEWLGSSAEPSVQEFVERVRLKPLSIHLRFTVGTDARREVVWVEGRNDGKMLIHPNPFPLIGFSRILRMAPDNPLAKARSNYDIRDAGVQGVMVGLVKAFRENSVARWDYLGKVDFDGRSVWRLEGADPDNRPPVPTYMTMYVDPANFLPVYFFGRNAEGRPMTRAASRDAQINIGLTDDHYDPRKLWP